MNRTAEPYLKVSEVVNGFAAARILQLAVELDVFTRLANEAKTAAQLATLIPVHPDALERLLDALVAMGFLAKDAERFRALPISHTYLARSGPKYMGHFIQHLAHRWEDWGRLRDAIQSGKPVRKSDLYEQETAADRELFIRGLHELALARGDARWLARAVPLGRCRRLVDVGGGPGTYAALLCRANRELEATVLDLPATLEVTRKILREFDTTGRVRTLAGDYRSEPIPGGPYDVALLSNVLHAEDEPTNLRLLQNVHDALVPGGILIIKDHVMSPDHTSPENGAVFALELLLGTRGRSYSFAEISGWMEKAGFRDMVEVPVGPPAQVSLVLALRPGKRALVMLPKPAARAEVRPEPAIEPEPELPPPAQVMPNRRQAPVTQPRAPRRRPSRSARTARS
jgi:SAM-dependent methyltransferase